jgi:hypothetical protein
MRPFSIEKAMYTICSQFAICSCAKSGTALFRPLVANFESVGGLF